MISDGKISHLFAAIIMVVFGLIAMLMTYWILQPIFIPLVFAGLFAVVFSPLYDWLVRKSQSEVLSSLLCSIVLIVSVAGFISLGVYFAVGQVVSVTNLFTQSLELDYDAFFDQQQLEIMVDQTIEKVNEIVDDIPYFDTSLSEIAAEVLKNIPPLLQNLSSGLLGFLRLTFDSAASVLVNLVIFFISFFFLLIDGKKFLEYSFRLLPINALHERQITKRFSNLCFAWIVVSLTLAVIQGIFAAIGFAIIGVPSATIWGIVTMFAAFIPFIGGSIVWVIIGLIYLILGKYGSAIFILIWGATLISSSDNLLRPFLLRGGVKIHPLLLFIAVLGGFFSFGVAGFILGPIIIVFISTFLYIYELEFSDALKDFHRRK